MKFSVYLHQNGFTLVEVILAVSIFAAIVTGVIGAVTYGAASAPLSGAQARATYLAEEGLEAVRSIKDEDFYNISTASGNFGLQLSAGKWNLQSSPDVTDIFTRTINFTQVASSESQVKSTVTWTQNGQRTGSITLTSLMDSWATTQRGGILGHATSTTGSVKPFDNMGQSFSGASTAINSSQTNVVVRTSPIKSEAIMAVGNSSGTLTVLCSTDGTTWNQEFTASVGGTGTTRRFSVAYEQTTGDVMVIYATGAAGNNTLTSKVKSGTFGCGVTNAWTTSAMPSSPALTTGTVQWIRSESSPVAGSNNIGVAWNDSTGRLGAAIWNGSSWSSLPSSSLETSLERVSGSGDSQSFDLVFESSSGDLLVVWGVLTTTTACTGGTNCMRYRVWTASSSTWDIVRQVPSTTAQDSSTNIDISANPTSDEVFMAAMDNGTVNANKDDLTLGYWTGSAWSGTTNNMDTTAGDPVVGSKLVATGWLNNGSAKNAIAVYMDASGTAISWYSCSFSPLNCTKQSDFPANPAIGDPKKWMDIQTDPFNQDRLIITISDLNNALWAKQLRMSSTATFTSPNGWLDLEGGSSLGTLSQGIAQPFSFAYWKNP
jgi:prepilin-type N-terminal cleavage/methylation domain-containing protein